MNVSEILTDYWSGAATENRWVWSQSVRSLCEKHGVNKTVLAQILKENPSDKHVRKTCACKQWERKTPVHNRSQADAALSDTFVCDACIAAETARVAEVEQQIAAARVAKQERQRLALERKRESLREHGATTAEILGLWDETGLSVYGYPEPLSIQIWQSYSAGELRYGFETFRKREVRGRDGDSPVVTAGKYISAVLRNVRSRNEKISEEMVIYQNTKRKEAV